MIPASGWRPSRGRSGKGTIHDEIDPCRGVDGAALRCRRWPGAKTTHRLVRPAAASAAGAPQADALGAWTLGGCEDWLIGRIHRAVDEQDIDATEAERVYGAVASMRERAKMISQHRGRPLNAGENEAQLGRLETVISSVHWHNPVAFQEPW